MKKFIYAIFAFAVLAFVGCTKEDIDDVTVQPGEAISFGVMTEGTRTVYGSQNTTDHTWPIYWTSTDQIRVFSAQAQSTQSTAADVAYADYKVNGNGTASKATIAAVDTNKALKWNSEYGVQHTFYATYPGANNNITVDANGIATFPINRNQICDLESSTDGNYVFKPRMENQYMVATAGENPKDLADGEVWLDFKPVMTTLDIIVNGQAANNYSGNITVTGVSIIMEYNTTAANASTFAYDIEGGHIVASASSSATTNTVSNTIFIGIENGDVDAIELAPGKTLKLTAFVPPVQGVDYTMKVRVHAAGTTELIATLATATAEGGATIKGTETKLDPSSKAQFILPVIPNPLPAGNNWITPLSDDIYVSQLSIPGTHDAASKECTSVGRTQDLTILEQLNIGIRAFDLRPTCPDSDGGFLGMGKSCKVTTGDNAKLPIYHGIANCNTTLVDVFAVFNEWLDDNPGEFIIVTLRWEEESNASGLGMSYEGSEKWSTFEKAFTNFLNNEIYYPLKRRVEFKKDLTVGDMRADYDKDGKPDGKILIICRPSQGSNPDSYYTGTDSSIKATNGTVFVTGWPANQENPYVQQNGTFKMYYEGASVGTFMCQDYYQISDFTKKSSLIKDLLAYSTKAHTDNAYINTWFINHCSGYENGDWIELWPSVSEYAENSRVTNQDIFNYLNGKTTYNGSTAPVGSTGIMMLDFVGSRTSSTNHLVYGDILPQVIIDNNYKYTMKRKTN